MFGKFAAKDKTGPTNNEIVTYSVNEIDKDEDIAATMNNFLDRRM